MNGSALKNSSICADFSKFSKYFKFSPHFKFTKLVLIWALQIQRIIRQPRVSKFKSFKLTHFPTQELANELANELARVIYNPNL